MPCPYCTKDLNKFKIELHTKFSEDGRSIIGFYKCMDCGHIYNKYEDYENAHINKRRKRKLDNAGVV